MSRLPLALLLGSAVLAAEPPSLPPATAPAAPPRAVSPAMADLLKSTLPKLAPVQPPEEKPAAEAPDLRATDKPKNGIVRLPKYVVREPKPPVFTERELWGDRAFGRKLARRYYPEWYLAFNQLARYTPLAWFIGSAEGSALARYAEEERLRKMGEFDDLTNMVMRSNPAAGAKAHDLVQGAFIRTSDFGWQGGGPK